MKELCKCCSGKTYIACCEPFHKGDLPSAPLQLMRSRYSGYALSFPWYIIATTHKEHPDHQKREKWDQEINQFSKNTLFHKLEIIQFTQDKEIGTVTFVAHLEQGRKKFLLKERSLFKKEHGKWLYHSGEIF